MTSHTLGSRIAIALLVALVTGGGRCWADDGVRCVDVIDGDTLVADGPGGRLEIDLWGIDAPEDGQPFATEARDLLFDRAVGAPLSLEKVARPATGRVVARVAVEGHDLSKELIESGLAWLPQGGETSDDYALALFMARAEKRGMWVTDEKDLKHPEFWRAEMAELARSQLPTPTPKLTGLAAYAGNIKLTNTTDSDEGPTIEGIPSRRTQERETQKFYNAIQKISPLLYDLRNLEAKWERKCLQTYSDDSSSGSSRDGSYWSDEEGRWIHDRPTAGLGPTCDAYRAEIHEHRQRISRTKAAAVAEAQRFGVPPGKIQQVVERYKLTDF